MATEINHNPQTCPIVQDYRLHGVYPYYGHNLALASNLNRSFTRNLCNFYRYHYHKLYLWVQQFNFNFVFII